MKALRRIWNEKVSDAWKHFFIQQADTSFVTKTLNFVPDTFLENLYHLKHLCAKQQKFQELSGLLITPNLLTLDLSDNELNNLYEIQFLTKLQELNLRKNSIKNLNDLYTLHNLQKLDIEHNRVQYLFPLFKTSLQELYAANNRIKDLSGIESITSLNIIELTYNKITSIECLPPQLKELWVAYNLIEQVDLSNFPHLEIIDLSFNPLKKVYMPAKSETLVITTDLEPTVFVTEQS